jgi:hypothetical protein
MGLTTVTVTAKFSEPDGAAASGHVDFQLSSVLIDGVANEIREPTLERAVLSATGTISHVLTATNSPGVNPTGATYTVTEHIRGAPERTYSISVDFGAGTPQDLADLVPIPSSPGVWVLPSASFISIAKWGVD